MKSQFNYVFIEMPSAWLVMFKNGKILNKKL